MESLITNIPLEETLNISCDTLFGNEAKINNFSTNDFEKLLRMALQNSFFNFDGKIYKQTDGVAMGSPLGPSLVNAFLCFLEQIWRNDCPEYFKPVYYGRYADDIFALFVSFMTIIKLAWFFLSYFQLSLTFLGFTRKSII